MLSRIINYWIHFGIFSLQIPHTKQQPGIWIWSATRNQTFRSWSLELGQDKWPNYFSDNLHILPSPLVVENTHLPMKVPSFWSIPRSGWRHGQDWLTASR